MNIQKHEFEDKFLDFFFLYLLSFLFLTGYHYVTQAGLDLLWSPGSAQTLATPASAPPSARITTMPHYHQTPWSIKKIKYNRSPL